MSKYFILLGFICVFWFASCSVKDDVKVDDLNQNDENEQKNDDLETNDDNSVKDDSGQVDDVVKTDDSATPDNNIVPDDSVMIDEDQTTDEDLTDNEESDLNDESGNDEDSDIINDPVILFEDFETPSTWTKWKKININKLMNSADPFLYSGDLWEIGDPEISGKITDAHSGENLLATIVNDKIPDNKNLMNIVYYNEKFTIPANGVDIEFYAWIDTHVYPNETKRGGVLLYLCEEVNFQSGGKCSKVSGDAANTVELFKELESDPDGYISTFYGMYTKQYLGLSGKSGEFVKITGSVTESGSAGKNVYLVFEYQAPNDSGTNVYGIYIDDISVTKR
ncbi:MAG TPA: hypothetical protein PLD55_09155 [bacterium]|jgi:hypothetical protein|nr:hypothetical protein [bacterium]MDX9805527.1 hypothetical protein [bacterium]HOG43354.1 hypothetical protein [bacterium]HPY15666.1 hypothetical protein [bacterium]HQI05277.1 hypothetical protein [bacterium]